MKRLAVQPNVSGNEINVSKQLYPLIIAVCREISRRQNRDIQPPSPDSQNWSPETDAAFEPSTDKRPDFSCNCIDRNAETNADYTIPLHVECKLLGNPTSSSWILNDNYVAHGIARFDMKSHKYGDRAPSGIMVGYIISMAPINIQSDVNISLEKKLPKVPRLRIASDDVLMQSQHQFIRQNVLPKDFTLVHLWVDIRNNFMHN